MPQGNQRILVVDDEAPIREVFAKGLRLHGYHCATAGNADEANQILQQGGLISSSWTSPCPEKPGCSC